MKPIDLHICYDMSGAQELGDAMAAVLNAVAATLPPAKSQAFLEAFERGFDQLFANRVDDLVVFDRAPTDSASKLVIRARLSGAFERRVAELAEYFDLHSRLPSLVEGG